MDKVIIQVVVSIAAFIAVWFGLKNIDFISIFHVEETKSNTEEALGEMLWKTVELEEIIVADSTVLKPIDTLIQHICDANEIDATKIKWCVVQKSEVNAFAMPDDRLVIYSGLITACEDENALAGVLSHEIAHMELDHVMNKLIREIGLSVILQTIAGGNGQAISEGIQLLSSSAYDRDLEKEADLKAVDYLLEADLNPNAFGEFLYSLGDHNNEFMELMQWISTHPDPKIRGEYIIKYALDKETDNIQVLNEQTWDELMEVTP